MLNITLNVLYMQDKKNETVSASEPSFEVVYIVCCKHTD